MVISSLYPNEEIPDVDLFTYQFGRKDKPFADDKKVLSDPDSGRSYTWIQAKNTAIEFGKGLKSQWGLKKGDAVGLFSPNDVDYAPAFFGILWAGGVASTANPGYTAKELAFQMKDSNVKGIITQLPFLPLVLEVAKTIGLPENRIILMGDARDPTGKALHFTDIRNTSVLFSPSQTRIDPSKDLAFLVYSSGTTGLPKGVMLTHRNVVTNVVQQIPVDIQNGLHHAGGQDGKGDKHLGVLPFFHAYGLTVVLLESIQMGLEIVVMPKFELERFCQIVQDHHVTCANVAPPIVLALAKHPIVSKYDLSGIKFMNSGAAPLGKELVELVWERLKMPIMQGYGMSECAPTLTKGAVADWAKFNGSCGKLLPNLEAKFVDLEGNEVPHGQEGELWAKGPNVFPGYLNRPDLQDSTFSPCGYYKTGDIGYVDTKGNLFITDRLKELIKYKGFQVAPAELEATLQGHPGIADACVIAAHDKERETEVPRAYVVLKSGVPEAGSPDSDAKAAEIAKFVAERVAGHKQLRGGVRFIDAIPKNASGKILRRVLRDHDRKEERTAQGAKL